jgi:tetrahydromethanopterin S-methyltransferase subunit G
VGLINSEAMPNNVAVCATITTAERGRAGRGRIYLAGISRGQTEQSYVKPDVVTAINGKLDDLLSQLEAASFRMGVYSRFYKKAKRDIGKFTPATSFAVMDSVLDSQRRRLPGRGV